MKLMYYVYYLSCLSTIFCLLIALFYPGFFRYACAVNAKVYPKIFALNVYMHKTGFPTQARNFGGPRDLDTCLSQQMNKVPLIFRATISVNLSQYFFHL